MKIFYNLLATTSLFFNICAQDSFDALKKNVDKLTSLHLGTKEHEVSHFIIKRVEKSTSYKNLLKNPESKKDFTLVMIQKGIYSVVATLKCFNANGGVLSIHYKDWYNGSKKAFKHLKEEKEAAHASRSEKNDNDTENID